MTRPRLISVVVIAAACVVGAASASALTAARFSDEDGVQAEATLRTTGYRTTMADC